MYKLMDYTYRLYSNLIHSASDTDAESHFLALGLAEEEVRPVGSVSCLSLSVHQHYDAVVECSIETDEPVEQA